MSPPRCGLTTVVVPLSTWSPVNSARSSSSKKHRWFGAWPGVCSASSRNSVPSIVSPSSSTRSSSSVTSSAFGNGAKPAISRAGLLADLRGRGPVVGMRVREQDPAHALAHRRADDRVDVPRESGPGSITATSSMPTRYVFVPGPGHQARDCSRRLWRTSGDERARRLGGQVGHGASRSSASRASTRSKRARTSRLRCVGRIRSISPSANARSTSAGRIHADATSSLPSCSPS